MKEDLFARIQNHSAVVAIVGLGYVGLPLAVAFAERGFPVLGIDVDQRKADALHCGRSYVQDISSERLARLLADTASDAGCGARRPFNLRPGTFTVTTDYAALEQCDAAIICVPTPLNKTRDPDVRYLISAGESVAQFVHRDMLVSLESTTYPGTTEELLLPMFTHRATLERLNVASFDVGVDFFLAFNADCGDGQAAREYLSGSEHRAGQRDGHHVRQAGHRCVGGDQRRGDQAVRLHEVHARARGRRSLHPPRPPLSICLLY